MLSIMPQCWDEIWKKNETPPNLLRIKINVCRLYSGVHLACAIFAPETKPSRAKLNNSKPCKDLFSFVVVVVAAAAAAVAAVLLKELKEFKSLNKSACKRIYCQVNFEEKTLTPVTIFRRIFEFSSKLTTPVRNK